MKTIFCDTSGLYAVMHARDRYHRKAADTWRSLRSLRLGLVTTNYVFSETAAIVQRRHGIEKLRRFAEVVSRCIDLHFIDSAIHNLALSEVLSSGSKTLSLVDCSSFAFMRRGRIEEYFGFDEDFARRGFVSFSP